MGRDPEALIDVGTTEKRGSERAQDDKAEVAFCVALSTRP